MDRDVTTIDPKEFKPLRAVTKIDPKEFKPASPKSDSPAMAGSVFESTGSRLKRFGRTAAKVAVGSAIPVGAAVLTEGASIPVQVGAAALSGAASPIAETLTGRALGENTAMPTWREAAKSGLINAVFTRAGALAKAGTASAVAHEMEGAASTIKNLNQAVRNRETWKKLGLSDEQADLAVKSPDAEQFYKNTVSGAERTKAAYQGIVDSARQDFKVRYDDAYEPFKTATVKAAPITDVINQTLRTGQHELTPSFAKFLQNKSEELGGLFGGGGLTHDVIELPGGEMFVPKKGAASAAEQSGLLRKIQEQAGKLGIGRPEMKIQDLRDLRTELRENLPASATNLDQKAYQQIDSALSQMHDQTLTEAGATGEQLGRIHGIDQDYGRMMDTIKRIDPRSEKFASSVNDALWDSARSNPDQAANFIRLAKAAEPLNPDVMPTLRQSFLEKAAAETRTGNTPVQEMKALQQLQQKWGGEKGTQVVLNEMFGKDSPLANPVTLAKQLGAPPLTAEQTSGIQRMTQRASNAPWLLRAAVIYGLAGGGMMAITRDPEKAAIAVAGLAGIQAFGALAGKLSSEGQAAYVNFRLDPSETNFKNFMRASGAMIGASAEMPQTNPK